jgi:hypothetical protein
MLSALVILLYVIACRIPCLTRGCPAILVPISLPYKYLFELKPPLYASELFYQAFDLSGMAGPCSKEKHKMLSALSKMQWQFIHAERYV